MARTPAGYGGRFDLFGWRLMGAVFRYRRSLGSKRPYLVDLGMGRGRDAIYFARRGFRVLGLDVDPEALDRGRRRAARLGARITAREADLQTVRLTGPFDVVYSSTSLNYLPRGSRDRRFAHFQAVTRPGGIHAVNAFLPGSRGRSVVDMDPASVPFEPGELLGHYRNWEILEHGEQRLDCRFLSPTHRHAVEYLVARRPTPARSSR